MKIFAHGIKSIQFREIQYNFDWILIGNGLVKLTKIHSFEKICKCVSTSAFSVLHFKNPVEFKPKKKISMKNGNTNEIQFIHKSTDFISKKKLSHKVENKCKWKMFGHFLCIVLNVYKLLFRIYPLYLVLE